MSTNVAMTVLLAVVCGGAAFFGAGKTWAQEKNRYNMHAARDIWDLTTNAGAVGLVWGAVALVALAVVLGVGLGVVTGIGALA